MGRERPMASCVFEGKEMTREEKLNHWFVNGVTVWNGPLIGLKQWSAKSLEEKEEHFSVCNNSKYENDYQSQQHQ